MSENNTQIEKLPTHFIEPLISQGNCVACPSAISNENSLDEIFVYARQCQASDVHVCVNNPIVFRRFGILSVMTENNLSQERIKAMFLQAFSETLMNEFQHIGDIEFVHTVAGSGRYRITLMRQRFGWDLTARIIQSDVRSFADSQMPESCASLTKWSQGLVLVTGPAGCGKSTTLSTLVEMINQTRQDHIITIESPIEVLYQPKMCQVTQREVHKHTLSQGAALRAALREDPDILVVSELRDLDSIQLAVTAAETGHLVFGTMNTNNAAQTVSSLVNSFPPEEQSIITSMIAESLRGVISQQLVPRLDGSGVVPAYEVLIFNNAVATMVREGRIQQINNAIATGKAAGMVLLDGHLEELVKAKIISGNEAQKRAINPKIFEQYLK